MKSLSKIYELAGVQFDVVCLFVVTPPLPRVEVRHAVSLIEIRLGERWQPISNQS